MKNVIFFVCTILFVAGACAASKGGKESEKFTAEQRKKIRSGVQTANLLSSYLREQAKTAITSADVVIKDVDTEKKEKLIIWGSRAGRASSTVVKFSKVKYWDKWEFYATECEISTPLAGEQNASLLAAYTKFCELSFASATVRQAINIACTTKPRMICELSSCSKLSTDFLLKLPYADKWVRATDVQPGKVCRTLSELTKKEMIDVIDDHFKLMSAQAKSFDDDDEKEKDEEPVG